ncbi:hypothetical protein AAE478_003058 [Parahypoxylon ruwenzoriense]
MSFRLVLPFLVLVLVAAAVAQNLTTYVPECAQLCVEDAVDNSGVCSGVNDTRCLCSNIRLIGPSSMPCCQESCSSEYNNSTEQIANAVRSGYMKFCGDRHAAGVWSTITSTSSPPLPTSSPASSPSSTPALENNTSEGRDSLSRGAIAGIAVGAGVGSISITGALLIFAFRLGKGRSDKGGGNNNNNNNNNNNEAGEEEGGCLVKDKPQLGGTPMNELETEYTLSGFDRVKELETREQPAELSAGPPTPPLHRGAREIEDDDDNDDDDDDSSSGTEVLPRAAGR